MRTLLAVASLVGLASLAACGGEPAKDPSSSTNTNGVTSTQGPAAPGDPSAAVSGSEGTKPESGAPASPAEGKCKSGAPGPAAKDLDTCLATCRGLDDNVPVGSRCISAAASCASQCTTKYKKP